MKKIALLIFALLWLASPAFTQTLPGPGSGGVGGGAGDGGSDAVTSVLAPTVNDDSGDGYEVGQTWIDTATGFIYQAADVTLGAAVWRQIYPQVGGDVDGPAVAVDNTLPRFDGTTGKLIQASGVSVDDSDNLSTPGSIASGDSGVAAGGISLSELGANGTNFRRISVPDALTQDLTLKLPDGDPAASCLRFPTPTTNVSQGTWVSCRKVVQIEVFAPGTNNSTGDGKKYFRIPTALNGMNLVAVAANVVAAGTTGTLNIDLARCAATTAGAICTGTGTSIADMLSTNLTIDTGENDSSTAAAAAVIDTANDDVSTGQVIRVDIDAVHTTPATGLILVLEFE